jgi:hypothetical protein
MKVALLETGSSHDECLYAQVNIWKSIQNIRLSLVCNEKLKANVNEFDGVDDFHYFAVGKGIRQWADMWLLSRWIRRQNFDVIVINTAQGSIIKKLMFFFWGHKTRIFGILHNIVKVNSGSLSQQLITNRLSGYFVLNDYLLQQLDQKKLRIKATAFYPVVFPAFPQIALSAKNDETWICIPGQVELKRRDYAGLFDALEHQKPASSVRFILLGRCAHAHGDGAYVKQRIQALGLENNFMIWDEFIDNNLFHSIIRKSDFIMTLIHPGHISWDLYEGQITGAYNLAIGYNKPLLLHKQFADYEDFKGNAVFYTLSDLVTVVDSLPGKRNLEVFRDEKFGFQSQRAAYLGLMLPADRTFDETQFK